MFLPVERAIYRMLRVDPKREQRWNVYTISLIAFSVMSFLVAVPDAAPAGIAAVQPDRPLGVVADGPFNAAVSFVTNTNWQWFSGEQTDEPPHADDRLHRPELRVGGGRHGGRGRR